VVRPRSEYGCKCTRKKMANKKGNEKEKKIERKEENRSKPKSSGEKKRRTGTGGWDNENHVEPLHFKKKGGMVCKGGNCIKEGSNNYEETSWQRENKAMKSGRPEQREDG